jgi:hypothetical protein
MSTSEPPENREETINGSAKDVFEHLLCHFGVLVAVPVDAEGVVLPARRPRRRGGCVRPVPRAHEPRGRRRAHPAASADPGHVLTAVAPGPGPAA